VRPARQDDLARLIPIEQAAFAPRWRCSAETLALAWGKAATFTVAERQGEILGFQVSLASDQRAHLVRLTVHPAAQQSGVGARLLTDALARYAALNLKSVSLNTQSDNLPSQRLYAALNFRRVGSPLPVWERPV
jgi:ribosomal protein S18 acetylase RimI-like enzyme